MRSKPLADHRVSQWECKALLLSCHKSLKLTTQHPMADLEIKGANTFPTLHSSWGWRPVASRSAHIWDSVSEDVSIIHRGADLCGFIWSILKALGGTGKQKRWFMEVQLIRTLYHSLSPGARTHTHTHNVTGKGAAPEKTKICRHWGASYLLCLVEQAPSFTKDTERRRMSKRRSYSNHYPASFA